MTRQGSSSTFLQWSFSNLTLSSYSALCFCFNASYCCQLRASAHSCHSCNNWCHNTPIKSYLKHTIPEIKSVKNAVSWTKCQSHVLRNNNSYNQWPLQLSNGFAPKCAAYSRPCYGVVLSPRLVGELSAPQSFHAYSAEFQPGKRKEG